jgi:hypothetical protein
MTEVHKAQLRALGLQLGASADLDGPPLGRCLARVRYDVAALIKDLGFTRKRKTNGDESETEEPEEHKEPDTQRKRKGRK